MNEHQFSWVDRQLKQFKEEHSDEGVVYLEDPSLRKDLDSVIDHGSAVLRLTAENSGYELSDSSGRTHSSTDVHGKLQRSARFRICHPEEDPKRRLYTDWHVVVEITTTVNSYMLEVKTIVDIPSLVEFASIRKVLLDDRIHQHAPTVQCIEEGLTYAVEISGASGREYSWALKQEDLSDHCAQVVTQIVRVAEARREMRSGVNDDSLNELHEALAVLYAKM